MSNYEDIVGDNVLKSIVSHAKSEFPNESCGLIVEDAFGELNYIQCKNESDSPRDSFLIDPIVFAKYSKVTKFVVHSHPNMPPTPSHGDIAASERSKIPYMIVSYPKCDLACYTPSGVSMQEIEGRRFVYSISDCFSIVRDYHVQVMGIHVDDVERPYYGWWNDTSMESYMLNELERLGFVRTDSLKCGDVIVMQLGANVPNHLAMYLGDNIILHQTFGNASKKQQYSDYWKKNTVFHLRHKSRL